MAMGMLSVFRRRSFLVAIGFILLAAIIWYAGPYLAFADYQPLASATARLVAIALVVAAWAGSRLMKRLRAGRASDNLLAAVVRQSAADTAPSADALQLRERFEEAAVLLKQKRHRGHTLYDLPWYVIIGAPGSGKTTALINSGLHFPLEQRVGKGALRGVGGTRNCDWWFTDEAVFLDTAGRYTTHDSDAATDRGGWLEFLALLRKYRQRRPVNGIILAVSALDLMVYTRPEREAHVAAVRRRLDEINTELRIQLPVYLMVTKCDLVAGFSEYFDDLEQEGRAQVWGVTFPYEQTVKGDAAAVFPPEFDALMSRLNARVFARLEDEQDLRRRPAIFGFPQQMAALRDVLGQFVSDVFMSTRFDRQILLRGVYFTSGTQEGTPIDRLLGVLGRRYAVPSESVITPAGRGKAYFIERLLKHVLLAESGLAGVNRRIEMRKAAAQVGAYAALALVAVIGVVLFTISYSRNHAYIDAVDADLASLAALPAVPRGAPLEQLLPRLDAVRAVADSANRYRDERPWSTRWGLHQGIALGNAARDAYSRELDGALLARVAARIEDRLVDYAPEPEKLYYYLKAYLMLGDPERLDKEQLGVIADLEWRAAYPDAPDTAASITQHFRSLLAYQDTLRPVALNPSLVAQARSTIERASLPQIVYSELKLDYSSDTARALRLDEQAGLGVTQVFVRKSGAKLGDPVPSIYTRDVFREVTTRTLDEVVTRFTADHWVLGAARPSVTSFARLRDEVLEVYERDYIAAWDTILRDLDVVPLPSMATAGQVLSILSGSTSPLRGLLQVVRQNTQLVETAEEKKAGGAVSSMANRLGEMFDTGKKAVGLSVVRPGSQVTAHFAPVHRLVAGDAGSTPLDPVLQLIARIQQELQSVGREVGNVTPLEAITRPGPGAAVKSLQQEAAVLPPAVGAIVTQIGRSTATIATSAAGNELEDRYRQEIVAECRALIGRYPFDANSTVEATLTDFGRLLGHGGAFDRFFRERLVNLVDTSRRSWTWRTDVSGAPVGGSTSMLRQFEAAQRIRDMFFGPGAQLPEVAFTVTPVELDSMAKGFVLEIDGQSIAYRHGPQRSQPVKWPGGAAAAAASFEAFDGRGPNRLVGEFDGQWAWFRLLDSAEVRPETDTRSIVTFAKDGHLVRLRLDAASIRNPYSRAELQQLRCG
jgi:type VI secretion system protein ImpL